MLPLSDTIVAIATPPGEGAIGIIRLSGANAITIAAKIFSKKGLEQQPSHTLHFGKIVSNHTVIDEVVISLFKNPKSYTGEDVVEISCHGSNYILQQVVSVCLQHGARMAQAGEFTLRAFLNGKLDLTQAEAVADLIASQSNTAHRAAMHTLRGGFSEDLKDMREQLITFSALMELELDFSEEDVEFADRTRFYQLIGALTTVTQNLVNSFSLGNVIKNGVSVAIVGKPNAGKSTLLNTLLNEERAIVSDIAGTTRDTIEETLNINGIIFRLIDTAGIREHSKDLIELQGIERSREAMKKADIAVYLFDASVDQLDELKDQQRYFEENNIKYLLAGNKVDARGLEKAHDTYRGIDKQIIFISAKNKENINELKTALYDLVATGDLQQEGTIITNVRHYGALQEVLKSLHDIKSGLDNSVPGDLIALDIRHCLHYLGEITGEITTEDKLDYIFSKFCIGK
ncbi:tRNA uridine-5-carboxymethylaminomethyl(34) synthesis GTPase MnmE [Flavipsychrobacter stenotrophus]|uniref:tRNA modification GTPase MnmE n=1 Tax=Flavipsychrobacter stenotrophus TaxID=2077091 RepID=A0A2S7T0C9_9BACT|nr:tRNA uridine-5-carboxymethylaminomethyl(34) synthesis GTPase MnmE [Flavipsychrobacter stenotrophus]PQJ12642.1 tRNA uridine-5-carboxymethylaminomethyl(34) synthesis GTPase MnmE [Flavipsychrobacter stenotrophus]